MGYALQRAEFAYAQFIRRFAAANADNTPLFGALDPASFPDVVSVSRDVVLNRFLTENKEYQRFRRELAEFRRASQPTAFPLDKNRWEAAK